MKKKEKITYIDDGRTLADMSGVQGGLPKAPASRPVRDWKAVWQTYWLSVRLMLLPMLVFLAGMALIFGIAYLLFLFN